MLIIFASLPKLNFVSLWDHTAADKDAPAMPVTVNSSAASRAVAIAPSRLRPSHFSQSIYGDSAAETDGLLAERSGPWNSCSAGRRRWTRSRNLGSHFRASSPGMCSGSGSDEGSVRNSLFFK